RPIYKDPARPVPERVRDLLARMTPEEKFAQLHAFWLVLSETGKHHARSGESFVGGSDDASVQRRLANGMGQITRPLGTRSVDAASGVRALNKLQRFLRNETRLGIPALSHEECLMGMMTRDGTLFPSALALSSTWNPELVQQVAEQIGAECRQVNSHQG